MSVSIPSFVFDRRATVLLTDAQVAQLTDDFIATLLSNRLSKYQTVDSKQLAKTSLNLFKQIFSTNNFANLSKSLKADVKSSFPDCLDDIDIDKVEQILKSVLPVDIEPDRLAKIHKKIEFLRPALLNLPVDFQYQDEKLCILVDLPHAELYTGVGGHIYDGIGGRFCLSLIYDKSIAYLILVYILMRKDHILKPIFDKLDYHDHALFTRAWGRIFEYGIDPQSLQHFVDAHARFGLNDLQIDGFLRYTEIAMAELKIPQIFIDELLHRMDVIRAQIATHIPQLSTRAKCLYTSIGGDEAIKDVIEYFVRTVIENSILGIYFKDVNTVRHKLALQNFMKTALKGSISIIPPEVQAKFTHAHQMLGIEDQEFQEALRILKQAFENLKTLTKEQVDLVYERLIAMKDLIVKTSRVDY